MVKVSPSLPTAKLTGASAVTTVMKDILQQEGSNQITVLQGIPADFDINSLRSVADEPICRVTPQDIHTGTELIFQHIIDELIETVEKKFAHEIDSQRLYDFIALTNDYSCDAMISEDWLKTYCHTFGRLWKSIVQLVSPVVIISDIGNWTQEDRTQLHYLCRLYQRDPIESLIPGAVGLSAIKGRLIVVTPQPRPTFEIDDDSTRYIDVSETRNALFRQYLSQDSVIEKLATTTDGDLHQLETFVDNLPEQIESLWLYRYENLIPGSRTIIDILAHCDGHITAPQLHFIMEKLGFSGGLAGQIKHLLGTKLISRDLITGNVYFRLSHPPFGDIIRQSLDDDDSKVLYALLAGAEKECSEHPSIFALSRYYLFAGMNDEAMKYGLKAARLFVNQKSFEKADDLLTRLLQYATNGHEKRAIYDLLTTIHSARSDYSQALIYCRELMSLAEDNERAAIQLRLAHLASQIGRYDESLTLYEQLLANYNVDSDDDWDDFVCDVYVGKAQIAYSCGDMSQGENYAYQVLNKIIDRLDDIDAMSASTAARIITVRNLLGRFAIFHSKYCAASEYFEENYSLALRFGLNNEMARAQANLGVVSVQQRKFSAARQQLERALELSSDYSTLPQSHCFLNLAIICQREANFEQAITYYTSTMQLARQSQDFVAYGVAAFNLATVYHDIGAFGRSESILQYLSESDSNTSFPFLDSWTQLTLGQTHLAREDFGGAIQYLSTAINSNSDKPSPLYTDEARLRLAQAYIGHKEPTEARNILSKFQQSPADEEPQLSGLYLLVQAMLHEFEGNWDAIPQYVDAAYSTLIDLGQNRDALYAQLIRARSFIKRGQKSAARILLEKELRRIQEISERIPDEMKVDYFEVPVNRRLIAAIREISGDMPINIPVRSTSITVTDRKAPAIDPTDPSVRLWRRKYSDIIGESPQLYQVFRFIDKVACSQASVLIYGESGTGKELVAHAIHAQSDRKDQPFVKVNCAAFVDSLLLSELFGHEKGAFTGASAQKAGRFELADGGTLFLDEIGDISPATQVALLRVLQEGTFERVGGAQTMSVDVRIVCATNKNLEEMVKRGEFRLDLYYRLKGVVIEMPELRNRREDIPRLVAHFLKKFGNPDEPIRVEESAMRRLISYSWPGNIRELENFAKSVLLFVEQNVLTDHNLDEFQDFFADGEMANDIPDIDLSLPEMVTPGHRPSITRLYLGEGDAAYRPTVDSTASGNGVVDAEDALVEQIVADGLSLTKLKKRLEIECIKRALIETDGNITRAADLLQMKRPRLSQIVNSTPELLQCKEQLVG